MITKSVIIEEDQYKVLIKCAGCGKEVRKYKSQLIPDTYAFCSRSCRNANYKTVHKEWHPPNYRGKIEHICQGCGSAFSTKHRARYGESPRLYCSSKCRAIHHPRRPHSKATKAKLSKAAAKQCRKYGGTVPYVGLKGHLNMRSGWEVKYAQWMDSKGIDWEYEPKGFELSTGYEYIPDFKLNTGVIIEIKGYFRDDAKKKWNMFCKEYPEVDKRLLMKEDLQGIGII